MDMAKTLNEIARNSRRYADYIFDHVNRERWRDICTGRIHIDVTEGVRLDKALDEIPLHALPHDLVGETMILRSNFRQLSEALIAIMNIAGSSGIDIPFPNIRMQIIDEQRDSLIICENKLNQLISGLLASRELP